MQIRELRRDKKQSGENIVEYEADNFIVRLIKTYDDKRPFDELLYVIACRKLAEIRL